MLEQTARWNRVGENSYHWNELSVCPEAQKMQEWEAGEFA